MLYVEADSEQKTLHFINQCTLINLKSYSAGTGINYLHEYVLKVSKLKLIFI